MLVCNCGWKGVNLLPNYKHDTAHCPECKEVFSGIKSDNAIGTSDKTEREIVTDYEKLMIICEALADN